MFGLSGVGSHDLISPGLSLQIAWYLDISDGLYLDNSAAGLVKSYLRLPGTWYLDIGAHCRFDQLKSQMAWYLAGGTCTNGSDHIDRRSP